MARGSRRRASRGAAAPPALPGLSPLESLPDSVLTTILLMFPLDERLRLSAVSRRFAVLLRQPEPLAQLRFWGLATRGRCDNAALARLCRYAGGALRVLDLADAPAAARITGAGLVQALRPCAGLRRLVTWRPLFTGGEAARGPAPQEPAHAMSWYDATALRDCCPLLGPDSTITITCSPAAAAHAFRALPGPRVHVNLVAGQIPSERLLPLPNDFVAAAKASRGLSVLAAPNIELGDAGAAQLAAALVHAMPTLRRLELNRNRLGDVGAAALAQLPLYSSATNEPHALRTLTLRHNTIGDAGVAALALIALGSLHLLDLQDNAVGVAGAAALAAALERGSPLRHLDLRRNRVGSQGATQLLSALEARPGREQAQLQVLNLSYNALGAGGEGVVAAAAELFAGGGTQLRLKLLCLTNNGIADEVMKGLDAACNAHRRRLQEEANEYGGWD